MKQNVVLFSFLTVGALYIWYGTEENPISLEEIELESLSPNPDEKLEQTRYQSRKLLFHTSSESEPKDIDISATSIDTLGNSSLETLSNKISHSLRASRKKSTGRRKRRVPNSKEHLAWKFNLNVTRYENVTPKNKVGYPTESKVAHKKSEKDKYLGMSLSVAGNGPDQSLEELYQAWDSVGQFLRSLFGGNLQELKDKGHGVSVDIDPLPNGTKNIPVEFFMESSGDEGFQEERKREAKFIFGLFGTGANTENPPRDEGSGEPLDTQDLKGTEVLLDIQTENNTQDGNDSSNTFEAKGDSVEISSISTIVTKDSKESVTSSSNLDETPLTVNPANVDITPSIPIGEEAFSEDNCTDCEVETENISTDGKGSNEESLFTFFPELNTTEFPFNAEALADFCNALFTRLRKSPQTMERSVGNEGSGSFAIDGSGVTINTQASNVLTDKPTSQNFGFFERIWNRIWNRNKNVPVQEAMNETRGARLVNIGDLFGGFGSGRSGESGVSSNFEFDNFQAGVTETDEDNEQFLSDCEAFFMSVQTDTRPNIFDLINTHPEEHATTEFTLKSGKSHLNEHARVENLTVGELALDFEGTSLSEGLTVLPLIRETDRPLATKEELSSKSPSENQFITEAQDKRLLKESKDEKPFESSTKTEDTVFTEYQENIHNDSLNVRNLVEENMSISPDFQSTELSNLSFFTNQVDSESTTVEFNGTHLDGQRSFNLFGFGGSGNEEVSDEGSADLSSNANERSFGVFGFVSGERELKENDFSTEDTTESFKGRSFFPSFGSGGRELGVFNSSEWEIEESSISTTEGRGRFFVLGSGERELKETLDTTTENIDAQSNLFLTEESVVATLTHENSETSTETPKWNDSTTVECDDSVQNLNDSDVTMKNDPRLIGTIFLTGSGEGGLFADNKGPIKLVQEPEFTSQVLPPQASTTKASTTKAKPPQPGRGARKHDPGFQKPSREITTRRNFEATEPAQFTDAKHFVTLQQPTAINDMSTSATKALDGTTVVLETTAGNVDSNPTTIEPKIIDETIASTISLATSKSVTELVVTTSGVLITTSQKITPRTKILELPRRFCSSASECNRALNERCISSGTTATCNCGRSYIRSPETRKCESPVVLKTSLKLPGEVFHQDLKNRNSDRFQKKRNDSIETMMLLLGDDPDLFRTIAGVEVSGFEEGSLVVHWEITVAPNDTATIPNLIDQVGDELKEAFEDEALLGRAPLNVTNAVLMAVTSDMDPCEKTERNYCSKNAVCIPHPLRGFECRCKEEYLDKSMDAGHPGEVCVATCPPYYCGDHGECNLKENGNRHCSCNGWFFGERCEISGIIVIAGFASFNVVLIIVVITLVCICRKRRYRQSRFYGQNQVRFQQGTELGRFTASPRLADTIAMNDVGPTKASKYMAISTPLHNAPTIQIKSPSIIGSSVDYDYESTFDRTPSAGEASVEVHKMEETHPV